MLDPHNLPLSFLGPPLAALHSMAEMKANANGGNGINSFHDQKPTQTQLNSHGTANPHGIDTILSRPPPTTSASAAINAMSTGKFFQFFITMVIWSSSAQSFEWICAPPDWYRLTRSYLSH